MVVVRVARRREPAMPRGTWLLLLAAQAGWAAPPVTYQVRADAAGDRLDVSVCVPAAAEARRFVAGDENAGKLLGATTRDGGRKVERSEIGRAAWRERR